MSGFAAMNGFADREPVLPPMYLADSVAGLHGAAAAMIALREAERKGGSGQVIDLPLLEPLFNILGPQAANLRLTGKAKLRTGNRSTTTAPRNAYRTKDGRWVCLSASIQKMAERLFRAIGRPELIDDPRYATNSERLRHATSSTRSSAPSSRSARRPRTSSSSKNSRSPSGRLRHRADPRGSARDRARARRRLSRPRHGLIPMHHVTPRLSRTPARSARRLRSWASITARCSPKSAWTKPRMRSSSRPASCARAAPRQRRSGMKPAPVWRSLLYVPVNVEKYVEKAHTRGADCILLDLEDSVPAHEKDNARKLVAQSAKRVRRGGADVAVRINRPDSMAPRDLEAAIGPT